MLNSNAVHISVKEKQELKAIEKASTLYKPVQGIFFFPIIRTIHSYSSPPISFSPFPFSSSLPSPATQTYAVTLTRTPRRGSVGLRL